MDSTISTFDVLQNRAVCPNCGKRLAVLAGTASAARPDWTYSPGDRVLLLRPVLRPIRRWDVVAYYDKLLAKGLAVKRVVALPGETIQIRDGMVWVNGQPMPRPWPVQRSAATPLRQLVGDEPLVLRASGDSTSIARYIVAGETTDFCFAHPGVDQKETQNRNVILTLRPNATQSPARLRIDVAGLARPITLRFDLPGGRQFETISVTLDDHNGRTLRTTVALRSRLSPSGELAISLVDGQVLVAADRHVLFQSAYESDVPRCGLSHRRLRFALTAEQGEVAVRQLCLWKVAPYTGPAELLGPLPGYYVLGDDPHISIDSRQHVPIPPEKVVGRVFNWRATLRRGGTAVFTPLRKKVNHGWTRIDTD